MLIKILYFFYYLNSAFMFSNILIAISHVSSNILYTSLLSAMFLFVNATRIIESVSWGWGFKNPTYDKLTTMHFYTWSKGLKTGLYYLRTKAKAAPQQFTVEPDKVNAKQDNDDYEEEECLMCGS